MKQTTSVLSDPFDAYLRLKVYHKGLKALLNSSEYKDKRWAFMSESRRVERFIKKLEKLIFIKVEGDFKNSLLFTNFEFYQDATGIAQNLINPLTPFDEYIKEKKKKSWISILNNEERHKKVKEYQRIHHQKRRELIRENPKLHEKIKAHRREYMKKYNLKKRLIKAKY